MKKLLALLLATVILFALASPAFAASDEATNAADMLHELGLFQGKGTNEDGTPIYDLDAAPTRNEAVTMLVRLLGKEAEAKAGTWDNPFTDVADWAKPYVGYAYANGLTKGTGDTTFGGDSLITTSQYLTFVLRALGYDSSTDFQWDKAWELSDTIGMTNGEYTESSSFFRGDVAIISANALPVTQKNSEETLAQKLIADGVFTEVQYQENQVDTSIEPEVNGMPSLDVTTDKSLYLTDAIVPSEKPTRDIFNGKVIMTIEDEDTGGNPAETYITGDMIKDGSYLIEAKFVDSAFFTSMNAQLTVRNGNMTAVISMMKIKSYVWMYMDEIEKVSGANDSDFIPAYIANDGTYAFEIPVEALGKSLACANYSKAYDRWYAHVLVFPIDSLPSEALK